MKYIFSALTILIASIYTILFTSFGNNIIKPVLEKKIQEQTHLNSKIKNFKLRFSNLNFILELNKNNTLHVDGTFSLISQTFNINYSLNLNELSTLAPLTTTKLNGKFNTNGVVKGNLNNFEIIGKSDVAQSNTNYNLNIKNLQPYKVVSKIQHLDLKTLLSMLNQKIYASAKIYTDIKIDNLTKNKLDGNINIYTKKSYFNKKLIKEDYNISLPKSDFSLKVDTKLIDNKTITSINFKAFAINILVKEAKLNLQNQKLKSDYQIYIKNLNNLYFITKTKLKGSFRANGKIIKNNDLKISLFSNFCDGKIDANLNNMELSTNVKNINTLKLLDTLRYPQIFNSSLNANLNYNLVTKKGKFNGKLKDGKFTKNTVLTLVKQYTNTNMYAEKFNGDIKANINKNKINSSVSLTSNRSSISTKNAKIDTKNKTIDANIEIVANKNPINVKLTGNINKPHVKVDANKLIKKEADKAINNFIKNLF